MSPCVVASFVYEVFHVRQHPQSQTDSPGSTMSSIKVPLPDFFIALVLPEATREPTARECEEVRRLSRSTLLLQILSVPLPSY